MLLQTHKLSINFGKTQVLDNVDMKITNHSRIGLIGVNGAGKSTLLKCLCGELSAQQGSVTRADNIQVKVLSQNPELQAGNTLEQELYSVFTEINELKEKETQLYEEMETLEAEKLEKALESLANVQEQLELLDLGKIDAKIGRMVTGLGFDLQQLNDKVEDFSGGWQMRINLAKVLLQEADVILMDEPTNHLDMKACQWLENFLRNYPKGILVVSHDRRFLDEVVTEIAELERGRLSIYAGNYTQYVEQRAIQRGQLSAAAQRQKKMMDEQKTFIDRFRASARKSTQAKSREKQLAKVDIIEAPKAELRKLAFEFPLTETSGREVLQIRNLSKSFDDKKLFNNISADLEWTKEEPQRVFILGANGCGKTTLFRMLMGKESCDQGEINFGHRVSLGYYAQHQLQVLDPEKTVLLTLQDAMPPTPQGEIRAILGRFLFSGEQVFKKVEHLSGGEKARLAIAKLMVAGPNTLLLDEPTNHLDTSAQEAVEDALRSYKGSVICISHDRYLIENHATQIWEFSEGALVVFKGSYQDYLLKRDHLLNLEAEKNKTNEIEEIENPEMTHHQKHQLLKEQDKQIKKLEKNIDKLNKQKIKLNEKIIDPNIASDYKELEELSKQLKLLENEISENEAEWLIMTGQS